MGRVKPGGGYVEPTKLPVGPNGRALCRQCGQEVPAGRRTFCADACVQTWKLDHNAELQRQAIWERDRGVCRECGLDTAAMEKAWSHARMPRGSRPHVGWPVAGEPQESPELYRRVMPGTPEAEAKERAWQAHRDQVAAWRQAWLELEDQEHAAARALGFRSASGHLWEMDHVREVARGEHDGHFDPGNLQTLCVPCHRRKTARFARERAEARKRQKGGV